MLTSDVYTDRVLGLTGSESYPNRLLTIFTGNNFTPTGELPRRVLTSRLDAQSERPYTRNFSFNPTDECIAHRQELVTAALTLLAGFVAAGRPRSAPALGSFEEWDILVRQPVLWVGKTVVPSGILGDPVQSILEHADSDPVDEAHLALMQAWLKCYGNQAVTSRDLLNTHNEARKFNGFPTPYEIQLADALDEFKTGHELTAKSIGRILTFRRDRIVGGFRIVRSLGTTDGKWTWRVQRDVKAQDAKKGGEGFNGYGYCQENLESIPPTGIDGLEESPQTHSKPLLDIGDVEFEL